MLRELTVENIAIIDRATLELGRGLWAMTGETGAGKSLLVDAIGLALGGRADSDLVRSGCAKGSVHLVADLSRNPTALEACARLGVAPEDGQLFVQRDVWAEGRSAARLNGKPVSVGALREIGALLVDLHGQHDHQSLLQPERQVGFLDDWIGAPARDLLDRVAERLDQFETMRKRLVALRTGKREREQRIDLLRHQVEEIETAQPIVGEFEALEATLVRLQSAERLAKGAWSALDALETEMGAVDRLGYAAREVEALLPLDPIAERPLAPLREALYALEDGVRELRRYADGVEVDPNRVEETAARLDLLRKLRRKYGDDEAAVLAHADSARAELESLLDTSMDEEGLEALLAEQGASLTEAAAQLTELRKSKAVDFQEQVQAHIRDLAMDKARFEVQVEPKPIEADGADRVRFDFTANPGEEPRPLSRVASGGEISRVMLAIKVASAGRAGVPTLVFDEVDTGLSGRAAAVTARKLQQLGEWYQVLVITHLPQIAGRASRHVRIEKVFEEGRSLTRLRLLEDEAREQEVARMLAGEVIGESALANAREILQERFETAAVKKSKL